MQGILVIDKPSGWTSFDVVRQVRRYTQEKRVGHAGTLDPMATGVLVVCVGEATKLVPYLMHSHKVYEATVCLGIQTDTDDAAPEARVLRAAPPEKVTALSEVDVVAAFHAQVGRYVQIPPVFSALKSGGVRLYEHARRVAQSDKEEDRAVLQAQQEAKQREVSIERIDVVAMRLPWVDIRVQCGAGTYIRSIARDAGRTLGVGGHLSALRRTQVGMLTLADATPWPVEGAPALRWLPWKQAVGHLPAASVDAMESQRLRQGVFLTHVQERLHDAYPTLPAGGWIALWDPQEHLVAVVTKEQGAWKMCRTFAGSC